MTAGNNYNNKPPAKGRNGPIGKLPVAWIYLVVLLLLAAPSFFNFSPVKEITWKQFENDMLNRRAVEKIVVVNNGKAEVYIKKEFARDSLFMDEFKGRRFGVKGGPHYQFNIGSVESFEKNWTRRRKNTWPAKKRP